VAALGYAIYTTFDFTNFQQRAGGAIKVGKGRPGKGGHADFGLVTGMIQSPNSYHEIWFSDYTNCCIIKLNLNTKYLNWVAGYCNFCGFRNGWVTFGNMRNPVGLIKYSNTEVVFYDNGNRAVRLIHLVENRWVLTTLLKWDQDVNGIARDTSKSYLYVTTNSGIYRIRPGWTHAPEAVLSFTSGHNDGDFSVVEINHPRHLIFLNDNLILIADHGNNVLRLVDLINSRVSSVCVPHSTEDTTLVSEEIDTCKVYDIKNFFTKEGVSSVFIVTTKVLYELKYSSKVISFLNLCLSKCTNL